MRKFLSHGSHISYESCVVIGISNSCASHCSTKGETKKHAQHFYLLILKNSLKEDPTATKNVNITKLTKNNQGGDKKTETDLKQERMK